MLVFVSRIHRPLPFDETYDCSAGKIFELKLHYSASHYRGLRLKRVGSSLSTVVSHGTFWLYAMGNYRDLLIPTFVTLLLLSALLMHIGHGVKSYLPRMILLCGTYSVVLGAFYYQPQVSPIWLGLPITAAFLLLPLWLALLVNIGTWPLWWWLLPSVSSAPPAIIVGYAALTLLLALPRSATQSLIGRKSPVQ